MSFAPKTSRLPVVESSSLHWQQMVRKAMPAAQWLERTFATPFTMLDGESGEVLHPAAAHRALQWQTRAEICRQVARECRPAVIEDIDPIIVMAIPLGGAADDGLVGVGLFLSRGLTSPAALQSAATSLGMELADLHAWAMNQRPRDPSLLEQWADLAMSKSAADQRVVELEDEIEKLSAHLNATFEEISLIYRVTQNLRISENNDDLGRSVLGWLRDVVPAEGLALQLVPQATTDPLRAEHPEPTLLVEGNCPLNNAEFSELIAALGDATSRTVVLNRGLTGSAAGRFPQVRQLVLVPLAEGKRRFGWLMAVNQRQGSEFGSVEASLLSSVAAILAIHSSNTDLYKQQADTLADVVRAMSSAIDAKDPYTRGHSDRVARVAVRLAQELGCATETLKTIYLAGLLHDIGKIGIDDNVLRKPGKLTDAEFEHVKQHAEIGYRILRDLRHIGPVLPVVLHHHEAWDGSGYPYGMSGSNIPLLARIVAVADSYDAMASDRPYRTGMADEKLDAIIRNGAGQQWDPQVVDAFFRVRDAIREISQRELSHGELPNLQLS
jgi:putative nucleotidyltransferase with HDIG domain